MGMLDMKVSQLSLDPHTNIPLLVLRDERGGALPIWIGAVEASAIATELEKIQLQRPMTHDLMKSILDGCGVKVLRVEVREVRDGTYYATVVLDRGGAVVEVDARPSDAIALALRAGARILVAQEIVDRQGGALPELPPDLLPGAAPPELAEALAEACGGGDEVGVDGAPLPDGPRWQELLESLSDEDFGKWKM